jgi:anti-sigma factor RsiW
VSDRFDISAYLDDELSPEERDVFEAELASDPDLAAELAEFQELSQSLNSLPRLEAPGSLKGEIMDKVLPISLARAASSMHPEKRGYEGMRARHEHRQKKRRRKRTGQQRDPFADDPFGDAAPPPPAPDGSLEAAAEGEPPESTGVRKPTLDELGPELTAYVDGELAPAEAERITALARRDPQVARELRHLRRIRSRIASLPRIEPPAHLTAQIMSEIDVLDREEAQRQVRARQARQAMFQNLSRLAQAACFLVVVGGGLFLSQPEDHPLAYRSTRPSAPLRKAPRMASLGDKKRDRGRTASQELSAASILEPVKVEASWTLGLADARAHSGEESKAHLAALDAAVRRTRGLVGQYATRLEPEQRTELDWGRVIEVPANRVDDFYDGLVRASGEVSVPSEVQESLKKLHAEQDRLILKSGFVLVGRVRRKGREYIVKTGSVTHKVPVGDVVKVEKADQVRRIRVLIR